MKQLKTITRLGAIVLLSSLVTLKTKADEAQPASGASSQDEISLLRKQIQELDQKVKILERNKEVEKEEADKKKKETPKLTANAEKGFSFTSADEAFNIQFHGLIQADARAYIDDGGTVGNDTFLLRRARPIIQGKVFRDYEFLFVPDFGGTTVAIQDAYVNYKNSPGLQLKAGKFKTPVGLELLQADANTFFTERGLPTNLVPNRDIGFQLWGELFDSRLNYAVGGFNGVGDARSTTNVDLDDDKEVAARIFLLPFKKTDNDFVKNLGFGVGGSFGKENGTGVNALPAGYTTDGQQTFFTYRTGAGAVATPNVVADGTHWRLAPQLYDYVGPFGLLAEYNISDQALRRDAGASHDIIHAQNTAWQVAGSWVVTGENASYNGVKPRQNFDPAAGSIGAVELVARYSELNLDDGLFPLYATASSAQSAQSWAVGVNWYLNSFVRVSVDYTDTSFDGGDGSNNVVREGERAVLSRVQLNF